MKNKKKRGFTLIELLAIIVILAIVAVITIPILLNVIENSRKGAAKDSAYGYKDSINKYYLGRLSSQPNYNMPDGTYNVNSTNGYLEGTEDIAGTELQIQVSGQKPSGGSIKLEKNSIKQACIKFGDYAITVTNGTVGEAQKGSCNGTSIGASSNPDSPTPVYAAEFILNENGDVKGYILPSDLPEVPDSDDYDDSDEYSAALATYASSITKPVKIEHPAIAAADSGYKENGEYVGISALISYRYMGSNPNNWIYFNCTDYSEDATKEINGDKNCERWRIISIENGQLKITTDHPITNGPWDEGKVNHGSDFDNDVYNYVNDWATSDLNDFLNGKYITPSNSVGVIDSYYATYEATATGTIGKAHGLLTSDTVAMIADSTWYLGGGNSANITSAQAYAMERGNVTGNKENFDYSTSINSKVAIISPSDYGYASSACYSSTYLYDYYGESCTTSNWMNKSTFIWLLSPDSSFSGHAWRVHGGGVHDGGSVYDDYGVFPSVYLKSDIAISGTGTSADPYKIIK